MTRRKNSPEAEVLKLTLSTSNRRHDMATFKHTLFFFLLLTQFCFAQWYQQTSGTTQNLNDLSFYDLNNGIVVGDSGIILGTTNGGTNWIVVPPSGNNTSLHAVSYKSGIWVAVGSEGTILRNGNLQTSGTTNDLFGISFTDANNGTAVGGAWIESTIRRTTDGGTNWTEQTSTATRALRDVNFTDTYNGWAVGGSDNWLDFQYIILQTTNGGTNWTEQLWGGLYWLTGVSFTDANNGTAVGGSMSSVIFRTTNGGTTWIEQIIGPYSFLSDVSFADVNNGTAVGWDWSNNSIGLILRTTNGGTDWTPQTSGTTNSLNGVFFIDALNGWAVGGNGTILHTTNGGVSFIEEEQIDEAPAEFLLSQNYPNPFNPRTSIQYAISSRQFVLLKVFDVLGNEIETLINEEKSAGTYEIIWYAGQLPSGVYFYQLKATPNGGQAGSFVETKKMILMK